MRHGWKDLHKVEDVLAKTRMRATHRQNFSVDRISELKLEYVSEHPQLPTGGYVSTALKDRKGKPMALNGAAISGACKLIGAKADFFKDFEDRNAFPEILKNKLDNPNRPRRDAGFKIRTGFAQNGIDEVIGAVLPGSYEIRDANEQLAHFAEAVQSTVGPIKGVQVQEQGFGDSYSYRMVIGDNIMPFMGVEEGQFMMFSLSGSETGLHDSKTCLGLYRLICMNGAMAFDNADIASWSHKSDALEYINKTNKTLRLSTHISSGWAKIFTDLAQAKLEAPAMDYLEAMRSRQMITTEHHRMSEYHAKSGMEPGDTQYDLYNLMTRAAQDLPGIKQRESAERKVLKIFTSDGGFVQQLEKAKRAKDIGLIGTPGHERPQPALSAQLRALTGQ